MRHAPRPRSASENPSWPGKHHPDGPIDRIPLAGRGAPGWRRRVLPLTLLVTLATLLAAGPARAGTIYRYEAEDGVVHFTNVPADSRYRLYRRDPEPPARPDLAHRPAARGLAAFEDAIRATARRHGVDARLVLAVVHAESGGNPGAVSPKGALGLMQLMPQRAAELGVRNAFDPGENLDGGIRHLRDLLFRFGGDVTLALAAYNAGEAAVRAHQGVPPFPETREYVRRVRALYGGSGGMLAALPGPPAPAPQQVYRDVTAEGTVVLTNVPPRPGALLARGR